MISVHVLDLGSVTLPDFHPRAADGSCPIQAVAIRHPDGVILFDTGVADDHPVINELYRPSVVPIVEALAGAGIDEREVVAIVNSHLHFDHCGQNRVMPSVPVWIQRAEYQLVDVPRFTVPEWASMSPERLRLLDGDAELAPGVDVVATPGHTPGHQSLVVHVGDELVVLGGQCCYTCDDFASGTIAEADCHDGDWGAAGHESLRRLAALEPATVHLSHDRAVWVRT